MHIVTDDGTKFLAYYSRDGILTGGIRAQGGSGDEDAPKLQTPTPVADLSDRAVAVDSVAAQVIAAVRELGDPERAAGIARYLQARPGGYGEGDEFVGVAVPQLRALARRCCGIDRGAVGELLSSPVHEIRFLALLLMAQETPRMPTTPTLARGSATTAGPSTTGM